MLRPVDLAYRLGQEYRDTGSVANSADQFLRWLNLAGKGMRNSGGIRPFRLVNLKHLPVHAFIVLVTAGGSVNSAANPWEDEVDLLAGEISYWGDAKWDTKRPDIDDFVGNRSLRAAFDASLQGRKDLVPPILHFSKSQSGWVRFNGLCALEQLEFSWFEDHGHPVQNYRARLAILDEALVPVDWLHRRMNAATPQHLTKDGPTAWQDYQAGVLRRLAVWAPHLRSVESQVPAQGSADANALSKLASLAPKEFEVGVVSLFEEVKVVHKVTQTRLSRDGGFDFFGTFVLPTPLRYEIPFRGEVKRWKSGVGPKDVSRLVARLRRGEFGLFVTTSYFTRQAQEEVLADAYPTKLLSGTDVVRFMKEVGAVRKGQVSPSWISTIRARAEKELKHSDSIAPS
jgi:Restriction endonuclease AspBHI N-terminal/Restriction endonuclease